MSITQEVLAQFLEPVVNDKPDKVLYNNPDRITISEMFVLEGREKPEYPEKTSRSKDENRQKTKPTSGIRTRATLVRGECSYHCACAIPSPF